LRGRGEGKEKRKKGSLGFQNGRPASFPALRFSTGNEKKEKREKKKERGGLQCSPESRGRWRRQCHLLVGKRGKRRGKRKKESATTGVPLKYLDLPPHVEKKKGKRKEGEKANANGDRAATPPKVIEESPSPIFTPLPCAKRRGKRRGKKKKGKGGKRKVIFYCL